MELLLIVLFLSPWLYFTGYLIYIIVQFTRGERLPVRLVIADMICMALLLAVYVLVWNQKINFFGEYADDGSAGQYYGAGIANAVGVGINLAVVILAFFTFQLFFMIYFSKELKRLRRDEILPHRQEGDIF